MLFVFALTAFIYLMIISYTRILPFTKHPVNAIAVNYVVN